MSNNQIERIIALAENKRKKEKLQESLNLNEKYLKSFNLILFTDGSATGMNKKKEHSGGSGIYVSCLNNLNSNYKKYNSTKISKKLESDMLIYYDIINKQILFDSNQLHIDDNINTNVELYCSNSNCSELGLYSMINHNHFKYCKEHKPNNTPMELKFSYQKYYPTNIRAEGYAILYALRFIKLTTIDLLSDKKQIADLMKVNDRISNYKIKILRYNIESENKFMIVTDSELWINILTKWINNWIRKNILIEKSNIDLLLHIHNYLYMMNENNIQIIFQHIKGHSDKNKTISLNFYQRGNVIADQIAVYANEKKHFEINICQ